MRRLSRRARVLALAIALPLAGGAVIAQAPAHERHHHAGAAAGSASAFQSSRHRYTLPAVTLRDQAGRAMPVSRLEGESGPLAVNFIFATCTTICPVMSATFSQLLHELGPEAGRIRLVSITIDPEHDTPTILTKLAKQFNTPSN